MGLLCTVVFGCLMGLAVGRVAVASPVRFCWHSPGYVIVVSSALDRCVGGVELSVAIVALGLAHWRDTAFIPVSWVVMGSGGSRGLAMYALQDALWLFRQIGALMPLTRDQRFGSSLKAMSVWIYP